MTTLKDTTTTKEPTFSHIIIPALAWHNSRKLLAISGCSCSPRQKSQRTQLRTLTPALEWWYGRSTISRNPDRQPRLFIHILLKAGAPLTDWVDATGHHVDAPVNTPRNPIPMSAMYCAPVSTKGRVANSALFHADCVSKGAAAILPVHWRKLLARNRRACKWVVSYAIACETIREACAWLWICNFIFELSWKETPRAADVHVVGNTKC